jgi:hypothetical protein
MKLPEQINAIKSITYDVESIVDSMLTMEYKENKSDITLDDIIEWIEDDIDADFNGSNNYVLQDENGEEL